MANANPSGSTSGKPKAPAAKNITVEVCNIECLPNEYVLTILVLPDKKDGTVYSNTDLEILFKGKDLLTADRKTDANGKFTTTVSIPYVLGETEIKLFTKVIAGGASDKRIDTFKLPTPNKVELKCKINSTKTGYECTATGRVLTENDKPRPNCTVNWSRNGKKGKATTDASGNFSFKDKSITLQMVGDELSYNAVAGLAAQKCDINVPEWKDPSKSTIFPTLDRYPNWKNHKDEIWWFVPRTIVIFFTIGYLVNEAGALGRYGACLFLGLVMWYKKDRDGKRGIWIPIIATVFSMMVLDSMTFICIAIILGLSVYMYEALTMPYDLLLKQTKEQIMNPYPKWPILFALGMVALLFVLRIPEWMSHETTVIYKGVEMTPKAREIFIMMNNGGLLNRYWLIFWNEINSITNWFSFAVIQFFYATPEEVMTYFAPRAGTTSVTGAVGFLASFQEVFRYALDLFRKMKKK